jgi:hypothetical protein
MKKVYLLMSFGLALNLAAQKVEKTAMLTTPKRSMLTSYFHLSKITI